MRPNYYGIIPADVRYAKIPHGAKLMYAELTALTQKEGYAWASNEYFAKLYDVDKRTISRWMSNLVEMNFVQIEVDSAKGNLRKVWLQSPTLTTKMSRPHDKNVATPHDKNVVYNNTSKNTKKEYKPNGSVARQSRDDVHEAYMKYLDCFKTSEGRYKLTDARKKKLAKRIDSFGLARVLEAIEHASRDDFYRGENDRGWKADLDYIIRSDEITEKLANLEVKSTGGQTQNSLLGRFQMFQENETGRIWYEDPYLKTVIAQEDYKKYGIDSFPQV